MVQSGGNERLTAFVSTIVAIAILAAGVTARHNYSASQVTDVTQFASDLRFQLEMGFRDDIRERDNRLTRLDQVMAAWQKSAQTDVDRNALVVWLREAGARSLPGAMRDLPTVPDFSQPVTRIAAGEQPVEHEVRKMASETGQVSHARPSPTEAVPTLESEYARQRKTAPVTPTPAEPRAEESISLRQPETVTAGAREWTTAQPAVAPRPVSIPEPAAEENLLASAPVVKKPSPDQPVAVNLTELAARITGYHDALDEVELALLRMNSPDLEVVTQQIYKLDRMTRDYDFVELYYNSLTDSERQGMAVPRPLEATLKEVARQLDRCEDVLDGDFLGSFDAAAQEEFRFLRAKVSEIERRVQP